MQRVASQLGKTRAMALSSYIDPMLFDAWGLGMDEIAEDAKEDAWSAMERQGLALREFAEGVSFVGGARPKTAAADEDEGND